jgi:hypothetical protein
LWRGLNFHPRHEPIVRHPDLQFVIQYQRLSKMIRKKVLILTLFDYFYKPKSVFKFIV